MQEASLRGGLGDDAKFSALDEDDFQTVIIENKLGCDVSIKRVGQDFDRVELLQHNSCASVWLPPPRYSDRLNVADESREPRRYVAVQTVEAKVLNTTNLFISCVRIEFFCFEFWIIIPFCAGFTCC